MLTLLLLHGSARDESDLTAFADLVAPGSCVIAPRGRFSDGQGFTFFRRLADRRIPGDEVVRLAKQWVKDAAPQLALSRDRIVVAGYSSGAIFAEALLSAHPDMFLGAILMRPEALLPEFTFPRMSEKPVLILAGRHDERRRPDDAVHLARQLEAAEAKVELHVLEAGHGWASNGEDVTLSREWLRKVLAG